MDPEAFKVHVKNSEIYKCTKDGCKGPVKPQIVFFGEQLPPDFFVKHKLVKECDLMIVMGTALAVSPFNMLVDMTPKSCHQVLINRENTTYSGFDFEKGSNRLFLQGNCDDVVTKLVKDLGWQTEFDSIQSDYK